MIERVLIMAEIFERFEQKYLLDANQCKLILNEVETYMKKNKFFEADINSIYFDTDNFVLINRSIEKPLYKEKLRIRSYEDYPDEVFMELKKKYDGVVYKRRCKVKYPECLDIYNCEFDDKQIGEEIKYALKFYQKLEPKIYVGSKRYSYIGKQGADLRITFDEKIRYRFRNLSLNKSSDDKLLTDKIVMEIKVDNAMPLWLSKILDEVKAYPQGYSKVGNAYIKEKKNV